MGSKGKRGGARTIYYYHNESIPLFVLDIYAKNEKTDLSEDEKRNLKRVLAQMSLRRKLGLSQSRFASRFGFTPATVKNWEQGRTQPDGPSRVLLAVIAHHPDAVEDALRKAS